MLLPHPVAADSHAEVITSADDAQASADALLMIDPIHGESVVRREAE